MAEKISVLFSEDEIVNRINELAADISNNFAGEEVHVICILKGSVYFFAELTKRITVPVTLDFMSVHSYSGTDSTGEIQVTKELEHSIEGKNVIVVEDIVDTGRTLKYLLKELESRNPKKLKLISLLDKPDRRVVEIDADYVGFTIPDKFVVGYGLDYDQRYRNLPYIGVVNFD